MLSAYAGMYGSMWIDPETVEREKLVNGAAEPKDIEKHAVDDTIQMEEIPPGSVVYLITTEELAAILNRACDDPVVTAVSRHYFLLYTYNFSEYCKKSESQESIKEVGRFFSLAEGDTASDQGAGKSDDQTVTELSASELICK